METELHLFLEPKLHKAQPISLVFFLTHKASSLLVNLDVNFQKERI